ncbi:hypothetical protein [Streptomyces phaeochromogenes]|nr:hypothetical protein OHB08_50475 [Streptomyces phaeochromogenes]
MGLAGVLGAVDGCCAGDSQDRYRVGRGYRLVMTEDLRCGIYL